MFRKTRSRSLRGCLALWLAAVLSASEHHGLVKFGGLPVPGATVTVSQGDKNQAAVTDPSGAYAFPDLSDGTWTLQVEMPGFAPIKQDVGIAPGAPSPEWELKMLPLSEIKTTAAPPSAPAAPQPATISITTAAPSPAAAAARPKNNKKNPGPVGPTNTQTAFQRAEVNAAGAPAAGGAATASDAASSQSSELSQRAADGLLINGTQNNGASSPFAINPAFGNGRRGPRSLYNGNIGFILDDSAVDARPFSLTGQDTARPPYSNFTGVFAFGGPLKIPHLVERNGPNFFVNYQWRHNRLVNPATGLVPDAAERNGDFSQVLNQLGQPVQIFDPATHTPFAGNVIPQNQISPQARALMNYYPLPNFTGSTSYNYQIPLINSTHQDSLQARMNKTLGRRNQVSGTFAMQDTRSDAPSLFGFLDTNRSLGLNAIANWRHTFSQRFFSTFGVQYSRQSIRLHPYFQGLTNVSGAAGITGNNQDPVNWGPPTLGFSNGINPLSDGLPSFTRNQTGAVSSDNYWNHGRHQFQFGGDVRRQQMNLLSQQNPRGNFTFTGAAAGYDFAGFLLGVPDLSSIAFGNADKYFRSTNYDAYFNDEWHMSPGLTLNVGMRWEYWSPMTEKYGRLVNLDIAPGFSAVAPVVGNQPTGSLSGQTYPDSLVNPDKHAFEPRVAVAWRPLPASSMIVRAGYGIYYNTSVYQTIATQMAQQSPLSYSFTSNNANTPLSLAQGFIRSQAITSNTFAIDPNFRVGNSQNWYVSVQGDLPGSLVLIVRYDGNKGTHNPLEYYPNTYPSPGANPCPSCPSGFLYLVSDGNAERQAGMVQLRRRLHNGFTATLQYTFAKAIDDGVVGGGGGGIQLSGAGTPGGAGGPGGATTGPVVPTAGTLIAQNWLDLRAERGLSAFDQRHNVNLQMQYTTGMGVGGGTLLSGWRGALFKQWTFYTTVIAGTGFPLTPIYPAALLGTGVNGTIRPNYTGAPLYAAKPGFFLNSDAYAPPAPGQWGNAGRNTITGPAQFSFNASVGRTFTLNDRLSLDLRVDAQNVLNHVTFSSWNTTVSNAQFGLPTPGAANGMRVLQTNVRLRF